jgi:hypothetical protein
MSFRCLLWTNLSFSGQSSSSLLHFHFLPRVLCLCLCLSLYLYLCHPLCNSREVSYYHLIGLRVQSDNLGHIMLLFSRIPYASSYSLCFSLGHIRRRYFLSSSNSESLLNLRGKAIPRRYFLTLSCNTNGCPARFKTLKQVLPHVACFLHTKSV